MANNSIISNSGKDIIFDRAFRNSPNYTVGAKARFGRSQSDVNVSKSAVDYPITLSGTESWHACDETGGWSASGDGTITVATATGLYKEGSGGLQLEKNGTASAVVTFDKTATAIDFSGKYLHLWLRVTSAVDFASGTAVETRFGSDSSNYWVRVWTKTAIDNTTVSNFTDLRMDDASPSVQVGSPATACDYFQIRIYTSTASETWGATDLVMDDLRLASDDDYLRSQDTGYPSYDTTNRRVTRQYTLNQTDAVGYNVDGVSEENTDSTPKNHSLTKMTDQSKSNTDQYIITFVDEIK